MYSRRVLLAVSGLTPQVITETVYALAVAAPSDERFVPTEVQVITTTEGARRVRQVLLDGQPGGFERLLADHALPAIRFDDTSLHLVADTQGHPLADIRSADDNARMADTITERVRVLTADPDCALHVSLAGGRKTMGYYAGYALSLFGREQDRLSHVLVQSPFETANEFLYPTPRRHLLTVPGYAEPIDAADAQISLAQIPFVRLRQGLPRPLLDGKSSFATTVQAASASAAAPHMVLDVARCVLVADTQPIELTPTQFALLVVLAQRARGGQPPLPAPPRDAHDPAWADEVLTDLRAAVGVMHVNSSVEDSLRRDCSGAKVSPHLSRLRKLLHERLAPGRDALYFDDGGTHRHRRYRVPLPPEAIEFIAAPAGAASLQKAR